MGGTSATITVKADRYVAFAFYQDGEFGFVFEHEGHENWLPAAVLDRFVSQRDSIRAAVDIIDGATVLDTT